MGADETSGPLHRRPRRVPGPRQRGRGRRQARRRADPCRARRRGSAARPASSARADELGLDQRDVPSASPTTTCPTCWRPPTSASCTLRDVPLFSTFIPSKMFEYLGAGRAVVGALRGESADLLRDAGGLVVPPDDPAALAEAIRSVAGDAGRREEMERAGRAHAEAEFGARRWPAATAASCSTSSDPRPRVDRRSDERARHGRQRIPRRVAACRCWWRGGGRVTALARSAAAADVVTALGAEPIPGDLDDPTTVDRAFASAGAACVGQHRCRWASATRRPSSPPPRSTECSRAIFVSTTSIFTNSRRRPGPRWPAEDLVVRQQLDWTIVRPTMIYGRPDDRNMARLLRLLRRTPVGAAARRRAGPAAAGARRRPCRAIAAAL